MRLRRETGDFQIVVTSDNGTLTVNSIRKGLCAEDLIGELVNANGPYEVVVSATDNLLAGTTSLVTTSYTLTYTKSTGAISAVAN